MKEKEKSSIHVSTFNIFKKHFKKRDFIFSFGRVLVFEHSLEEEVALSFLRKENVLIAQR